MLEAEVFFFFGNLVLGVFGIGMDRCPGTLTRFGLFELGR